jgi:hypothetical protein
VSGQLTATVLLTATCAALSYFSFRRTRDGTLAAALGILVFMAFVAGSLFRPVDFAPKRVSLQTGVAEHVDGDDRAAVKLDRQALDNLPNIPLPADGQIDFVGIRRSGAPASPRALTLHGGDELVLRGSIGDPTAHGSGSGLIAIVNSSQRIDVSSGYGGSRAAGDEAHASTGFVAELPASSLQQGSNQVQLAVIAADERGFFKLPDRVTVTVTER